MNHELVRPEQLFHHLFVGQEGYLATCYPDPETGYWPHKFRYYPTEVEKAAADVIHVAQQGINAYFGVSLFEEPGSRKVDNACPTVRTLWADLDGGRYPDEGPQPTAIIHSSARRRQRFHLYWRLTRFVSSAWAVNLNERIAKMAGADNKWALSSVLRPAGTWNYKYERPELVDGYFTGAPAWEPEVLDQAIPPLPSEDREARRSGPYDGPDLELGSFLANVDVIRERADSKGVCLEIICPWVGEHTGRDRTGTRVGQRENGALWFHCDHQHCQGRSWRDFKAVVMNRVRAERGPHTVRMEAS